MKKNKIWLEKLYPDIGQFLTINSVIYEKQSKFQKIFLFKNTKLGKVLVLDDILQSSDYDEYIYHEMLCLIPFYSHKNPKNILIIGGGDGGCLREITKFKKVQSITLVEIDKEVIKCSKKYLFNYHQNSFYDKRVKINIIDGKLFLKKNKIKFDLIIVDSTDPIGDGKKLFCKKFYQYCKKSLNKNGILTSQSGTLIQEEAINNYLKLKKIFKYVGFYQASIPSYYGGNMLFIWSSNNLNISSLNIDNNKIHLNFKYYNNNIHKSSFIFPQYFLNKLNLFK